MQSNLLHMRCSFHKLYSSSFLWYFYMYNSGNTIRHLIIFSTCWIIQRVIICCEIDESLFLPLSIINPIFFYVSTQNSSCCCCWYSYSNIWIIGITSFLNFETETVVSTNCERTYVQNEERNFVWNLDSNLEASMHQWLILKWEWTSSLTINLYNCLLFPLLVFIT
jgi:hypothetical protein